ncbi:PAS domain S-box protein [Dyadobacter sp. CY323]|uniref:sensor histidine kinase n=1 Tax=Dyadobacter sp. CY323 TaxID=2907302 RepID=UPI001F318C2B|nr:PAS domain-containing sensor histidine kinase [Dyadobacter sp. CY323]MCE6989607.1 PAS domain-containing sensor histidine kinase [Dyadobacter sp. CY323]
MTNLSSQPDLPAISKEHFFDISDDFLCVAGYDGYFKLINPAFTRLLGYDEQELLSRPIDSFVYPEDRELTAKYRAKLRQNIPLSDYENRYVTKNGEVVWLSWTSMPKDDEQLVYAIAKNVTHKKILENDRNTLLANLTRINQELKQLTYTTSHDLRSPVNNLLAIFSLLDTSKIEDTETLEFISILKSASENLKDTLNQYVDALIRQDLLNVKKEEISLSRPLGIVTASLTSLIENSKTTIRTDFSEFDTIQFNEAFMVSIFLNLISNSIKYVIPHHHPVISIHTRKTGNVKQLVFSDEGRGFDMDDVKDRVFGLNQTFHNHIDGKGIGLYLVHNQITSLGGNITLESKPGEGATFILSFRN